MCNRIDIYYKKNSSIEGLVQNYLTTLILYNKLQ